LHSYDGNGNLDLSLCLKHKKSLQSFANPFDELIDKCALLAEEELKRTLPVCGRRSRRGVKARAVAFTRNHAGEVVKLTPKSTPWFF
jgi:hypothetical protein